MQWVRADRHFQSRRAIVLITDDAVLGQAIRDTLSEPFTSDILELLIYGEIVLVRPDLKGCTIDYMGYDYRTGWWEVGISHASLDPVLDGCVAPRIELKQETGHPAGQGAPDSGTAGDEP